MRICLVSREYPPDTGWGGVGAYTFQMANALVDRGHTVHVVSLCGKGGVEQTKVERGVVVHRVEWEETLDELNLFLISAPTTHFVVKTAIALWRKFLVLHQTHNYDVVEVPEHLAGGFFQSSTSILPVVIKLHTPHSKFVAERFHGVNPSFDNQIICMLERIATVAAEEICSPSLDLAQFVSADSGIPLERIRIIKNPVNTERFNPNGERALPSSTDCTVLFVGRLEERKGINLLVDAIPHVLKRTPNARFVILGADTNTAPDQQSMLSHLQAQLRDNGCTANVQFIQHVPLSEMPAYYRSADVCVIPSLYDNAPYTCIEALSCGRPVVVSTAGGTKEYVSNGEWGYVVDATRKEELAQAISTLVADATLRTSMGAKARKFVEEQLSLETIAIQMEKVYEDAIATHKTKPSTIYTKTPASAQPDALQLLCAYDQMLFETLSRQSLGFRMRHAMRFFLKRPGLFAATCFVDSARTVLNLIGIREDPSFIGKLAAIVASKQAQPYGATMKLGDTSGLSTEDTHPPIVREK